MSQLAEEREFARQLLRRHETDRRRLSFALHDSLTHALAQISTNLDLIARESPLMNGRSSQLFEDSRALSRECFRRLREITDQLSTTLVAAVGLGAALECRIAAFRDHTGTMVHSAIADCPGLPQDLEYALFCVVEDILADTAASAPAVSPCVALVARDRRIELKIAPVGAGAAARTRAQLRLQFGDELKIVRSANATLTVSARLPPLD